MTEGKEIKCPKCQWKWKTKSKAFLVSCPGCGTKVKVREIGK